MASARKLAATSSHRFMKSSFVRQTLGALPQPECQIEERTVTARSGKAVPFRVYRPMQTAPAQKPVLVMAHSGGFCMGGFETEEFTCRLLCRSQDVIVVDVDYSLTPEAQFPTAVHEYYDVVKWVAHNAATLGADLSKGFIAAGVSAGGNLSVHAAYMARDEGLQPPLTGTLFVCTGMPHMLTDVSGKRIDLFPGKLVSWHDNKDVPIGTPATNDFYGELAGMRADDPLTTPFFYKDHSGLPPVFYQCAGMDIWRDSAIYYAHLLHQAGSPTRLIVYPGLPHLWAYFYPEISTTQKWVKDLVAGLGWLLSLQPSPPKSSSGAKL
ncbi:uncharacterized protein HMPREF1541_01006 [Cyphellophora europaea CBS 101466]|uniref:Alpha/beta hydrolase fold-3 domain-containing protein n=1 Tax=Cyphellophora europaea (strain CBS 101466) TaxID=1220924 RepID=W2SDP7_CYPE1|nr:uncharacterized protein HMPREF1541_01006 [Cyphellophora europaea CBS 101466]ETN46817.1 hypothetical protein HMPREF1541_01006 [Cyphellophora europaea CBS 101466]